MQPTAIFLMGPTAAGKSELAIRLAESLPCDIISVDSAMVYRGMDIGTAKPGLALRGRIPHRLIDIRDPAESYSAAHFRHDALREMAEITARDRIPLLVGGTLLYFRALHQGLAELPSADSKVRAQLAADAKVLGWPAMHARLASIDPAAAQRIHRHDPQRIQRALEVYELTGVTQSELYMRGVAQALPYSVIKLVLAPSDRSVLHGCIERRFHDMLREGLIEEVQQLRKRGDLDLQKPALKAVGYRQVWHYLEGKSNCDAMTKGAIIATRQLAKRQFTWLRAERITHWLDSADKDVFEKTLHLCGKLL
jgi:tRNA dimethylallyltransferase